MFEDNDMNLLGETIMDILNDTSGATENAVRESIPKVEGAVRELFKEPDMTMGAVAFAMSTTRSHAELAWMVTILLRDRIEFGDLAAS